MRFTAFLATTAALLLAASGAFAQTRTIPDEAKRAELRHVQEMIVEINGTPARLSASAQIRDQSNRIVVPSALPPVSLIKYLMDPQGQVSRVWILTPAEAAQRDSHR